MQANRSFWKAVHSLSHPISVLAILLLLFNDHYLRWHYPSWLTGKLGDFSWLVFAPFVAAMLFSWLAPQKPRFIALLSIGFIGLWFASFKTMPFVMDLTKDVLEALVGWRGTLGMDASDLLTLPALGISWFIWKSAREDSRYLRPVLYVAFGLGIMGTLASDSPVSYYDSVTIICESSNGSLYTTTGYYYDDIEGGSNSGASYHWQSSDGGLSWQPIREADAPMETAQCSDKLSQSVANAQNGIIYRWVQGERIEYSSDDGVTWLLLRDLYELRQDAREHINHNDGSGYSERRYYSPSPVSGIVHSETGNLVLAMSRDGVLVISSTGESFWATVGEYQLADMSQWENMGQTFGLYVFLIPTLFLLVLVNSIVIIHSEWLLTKLWLGLGWLGWLVLLILFRDASIALSSEGYTGEILNIWAFLSLPALFLIALPMSLWALYHLLKHYRSAFLPIIISATITCLANFFPMFLWSQGTIPRYDVAIVFSLGLTAAVLATCYAYYRPKLPSRFVPEKEKRKNDNS